jgi:hypothetical protein
MKLQYIVRFWRFGKLVSHFGTKERMKFCDTVEQKYSANSFRYVTSSVNCSVLSVIPSLFTYVEIEFDCFAGGTIKMFPKAAF